MEAPLPRAVAVPQPAAAEPPVAGRASALPEGPLLRGTWPVGWQLQLLAGPALTHRQLSAPEPFPNNVTRTERAGAGYMAQVLLHRTLSRRLTVAGGVGYTQYTNTVDLVVRTLTAPRDSMGQQFRHHDTYRYLTLPLQVQYGFRARGRVGVGLLGGGTLGFYQGGRTSAGSACGCEQRTWTAANSPYRRFNLSASAGLNLRYHLAPQWALTAQPTLHYSVLSISTAPTEPKRYPLAAGLLLGFTFGLP